MFAGCAAATWAAALWWGSHKSLPPGAHIASAVTEVPADEVTFIADITAADGYGRPVVSQAIFDSVLGIVHGARAFLVLDYALIGGAPATGQPALGAQLQDALLERRRLLPALKVLLITDPASNGWGVAPSATLALLRSAGVDVVSTDPGVLRDSSALFFGLWRLVPGLASRDHRKVIIADDGHGGLTGIVGSANPQDEQALWSNVAIRLAGKPLEALLASELALARASGWRGDATLFAAAAAGTPAVPEAAAIRPTALVQTLTEGATYDALLMQLNATGPGDAIDVAQFKLADRGVIEALLAAAMRGASVRVLLDPGDGAQGGSESIPNQPVASELESRSGGAVHVRWYRTHGERFHTSLVIVYGPQQLWFTLGSANLTRRSLEDYNLEANAAVDVARAAPLAAQLLDYFETLWSNKAALGIEYSSDFAVFADPSQSAHFRGRLLEASGLSAY